MNPTLQGKVVDVEVESEYRGSIYERTVRIQSNSETIDCFEGKSHVTEDDINRDIDIVLLARTRKADVISNSSEIGLERDENADRKSKWHYTIFGRVKDINTGKDSTTSDQKLLVLDIGVGTIFAEHNEEISNLVSTGGLSVGEIIQIECSRLEIIDRQSST